MRLSPEDTDNLRINRPNLDNIGSIPALPALDKVLDAALTSFPEVKAGESRIRQQEIGMDLAKTVGMPRAVSWSYGPDRQPRSPLEIRSKSSPSASPKPPSNRSSRVH